MVVLGAIVMFVVVHEEAAARLTRFTHAGAGEILIREGWLAALYLPAELLVDSLRRSENKTVVFIPLTFLLMV